MPQDITENNNVPMAMITADINSDDARTIMLMVQLFASKKEGTATAHHAQW